MRLTGILLAIDEDSKENLFFKAFDKNSSMVGFASYFSVLIGRGLPDNWSAVGETSRNGHSQNRNAFDHFLLWNTEFPLYNSFYWSAYSRILPTDRIFFLNL